MRVFPFSHGLFASFAENEFRMTSKYASVKLHALITHCSIFECVPLFD
jgi:hypothetical protein